MKGKFDICLVELAETDLRYGDELIDRLVPLMKVGGYHRSLCEEPRDIADKGGEFAQAVVGESARLIRSGAVPTEVYFVPANIVRRLVRRAHGVSPEDDEPRGLVGGAIATLGGGLLLGLSLLRNVDALRVTTRRKPPRHVSSFVMRLSVDAPRIY